MNVVSATMTKSMTATATITAKETVAADASLSAIGAAIVALGVVIPEGATAADYAGLITDNLILREP